MEKIEKYDRKKLEKVITITKEIAITLISLFAGCGGSSLGYEIAGFLELLAIEWEAQASRR